MIVQYEIFRDAEELGVRIYDAPAGGWRTLFVQEDAAITRYTDDKRALAGIRIYDAADKTVLFAAETEVYLKAARTNEPLGQCGLSSLVRFGTADHYVYVTFILPEVLIRQSALKIIGYQAQEPIYSPGWDSAD